jgi:hypothetical protein
VDTVEYLRNDEKDIKKKKKKSGCEGLDENNGSHLVDTSTRTGFDKLARCSLATLVVIVAENKYVVRSLGIALRMPSISGPKSMSNRRSASSRT